MLGVSNDKNKNGSIYVIFLVTMATKVGGSQVW